MKLVRIAMVVAVAVATAIGGSGVAIAAEPGQVQGLTVTASDGFATLAWQPVSGASDYQIERTPVDANGNATGSSVITGLWRPNRQVHRELPTFADAGFSPGSRLRWRVRARIGSTAQPYSTPVSALTPAPWGDPAVPGENLRTQWESTQAAQFTSEANESSYTAEIDSRSARVRVVQIGQTVQGRPINMFVIGHPAPPATPAAVAATSPLAINCNVHGNEPGDRESCLILVRKLAFSNDARTIDLLSHTTVLIVPSINGDGRAANTRGNATGQDLNRDYSLIRAPETFAFVKMLRDYRPVAAFDGHEFGNSSAGDLPMLPPRHQNVAQSIFDQSQDMIVRHMYDRGALAGWWPCPYGCASGGSVGLSEETILRNTLGLKNVANSLLELRSSGGTTRPDESSAANNKRRKTYSAMWTFNEFLDYHRANLASILASRKAAVAFQVSNTGRIVFRGSRPIPAFAAPHPGESPPPADAPVASAILNQPPCAYKLTEQQYHGARSDGLTAAERIDAHGWKVITVADGYLIPLAQPERGLIPLLLDAQATEELLGAQRVLPTLTGTLTGPLDVAAGTVACLAGATVQGPVTVRAGAVLIATGTTFSSSVTATGAAGVFLGGDMLSSTLSITGTTGAVVVAATEIVLDVVVSNNTTSGGATLITGNVMRAALRCDTNSPAPVNIEIQNTVTGSRTGQCAAL
ncbi:hypothetical protein Rhe02_16040 [Rhizocola hellebori]|uniref:Carboxypeptidase n=1 Tax=Rhizocola hellebori TaxID=1392758 RepID=A0A8J3VEQ4_9ACTN|nr:M14 family zinc carboxypeptidase [Rhizocola hellebori]GIH03537.1 hypothetical protein Rhe02_16040 [Rhizocola hellebori]